MAKSKTNNSKKTLIIVLCIVLGVLILAVAGAAVGYFTQAQDVGLTDEEQALYDEIQGVIDARVFIDGIKVDGVDVGGKTMDEAKAAVKEAHEEQLAQEQLYQDIIRERDETIAKLQEGQQKRRPRRKPGVLDQQITLNDILKGA